MRNPYEDVDRRGSVYIIESRDPSTNGALKSANSSMVRKQKRVAGSTFRLTLHLWPPHHEVECEHIHELRWCSYSNKYQRPATYDSFCRTEFNWKVFHICILLKQMDFEYLSTIITDLSDFIENLTISFSWPENMRFFLKNMIKWLYSWTKYLWSS